MAGSSSQGRITGYGVGAPVVKLAPPAIVSARAPTTTDIHYPIGQPWVYQINSTSANVYFLGGVAAGSADWITAGGATAVVETINNLPPAAGNITIAGTASEISVANAGSTVTLSVPSAFIAPGSIVATTTVASTTTITAGTGLTATTGNITASAGNLVSAGAGHGISLPVTTASGAASGTVTCNGRAGAVTFTSPTVTAGGALTLTIANSAITGSSTNILYGLVGCTAGTSLTIESVTNSAGQSVVVVTNAAASTSSTASITLTFLVLN